MKAGDEEEGATRREEQRGGRSDVEEGAMKKERLGERSLVHPSVNEKNGKTEKEMRIEKVAKGHIVDY